MTALDRAPNVNFTLASWMSSTHDIPIDDTSENPGGWRSSTPSRHGLPVHCQLPETPDRRAQGGNRRLAVPQPQPAGGRTLHRPRPHARAAGVSEHCGPRLRTARHRLPEVVREEV